MEEGQLLSQHSLCRPSAPGPDPGLQAGPGACVAPQGGPDRLGHDPRLGHISGPVDSGGQGASNICWSETILSGGLPKIPLNLNDRAEARGQPLGQYWVLSLRREQLCADPDLVLYRLYHLGEVT